MSLPYFSVVIPMYNSSKKIGRSLDSLLSQSFKDFEVIIIDDFSDDVKDSMSLIESAMYSSLNIRTFLFDENKNGAVARNKGIDLAKGRYIAFLDSDDEWSSEKLSVVYDYIDKNDMTSTVLYSQVKLVDSSVVIEVLPIKEIAPGCKVDEYLFGLGGFIQTSSIVISTENAKRVKFNPVFRRHQDYDFCIRAGYFGLKFKMIEKPLCIYNIVQGYSDWKRKGESEQYSIFWLKAMKKYLSRKGMHSYKAFLMPGRCKIDGKKIRAFFYFFLHLPFTGMEAIKYNVIRVIKNRLV